MSPDRRDEVIATAERDGDRAAPPPPACARRLEGLPAGRAAQDRAARRARRPRGRPSSRRPEGRMSEPAPRAAAATAAVHQRRRPATLGDSGRPGGARRGAVSLRGLARRRRGARHRARWPSRRSGACRRPTSTSATPTTSATRSRGCGCSRASTSAPRCAASSASPRTGPVLLVGNHSGGNMTVDTGRVHARLQHLLRGRAALLPAGPQPGALDARPRLPAQVRHGGRQPGERRQGARVGRRAARLPGRRLRGAPAHLGVRARGLRRPQGLPAAGAQARRADRPGGLGRRPGDGALPHARRGARQAAAARHACSGSRCCRSRSRCPGG